MNTETKEKEIQKSIPAPSIPFETLEAFNGDELRCRTFLDKYAYRNEAGVVVETIPDLMWERVATAIASVETTDELKTTWSNHFLWLLKSFRFIPGGRILFGAGAPRNTTLLNCYVIPVKDDNLESIFDWMKEAARTYSYGGGVGTDISVLRPKGSKVNNSAMTSTGSVSFMDLFSQTTGTIGQHGRRGALMITMRDSHPDILDFIRIKRNLKTVRYANISVRISDALMQAVDHDEDFELKFKNEKVTTSQKIKARDLWNELIKGARDWAEPGVIFWDTVLRESTSNYNGMEPISTNPCGEIPLEGYGDCCLGNLNLSKFVTDEFTPEATVNWDELAKAARYGVRFLDNVLSYNDGKHPLTQQTEASLRSRRIGLGFTGLGDMLCKLRLKYDSEKAIVFADDLFSFVKNIAYDVSCDLSAEKGSFPEFDLHKHLKSPFIQRLKNCVLNKIKEKGLRNVAILTAPPVGSGAILAGTTSGVEPIFALSYTRRSESLSKEFFKVYHPLVRHYMKKFNLTDEKDLPEFFVTAHKIEAENRVAMQAAIQKHIDHSISSTVNLPHDATEKDVSLIYFLAWKMGCKGITVYREGSREGILMTENATNQSKKTETTQVKESKRKETKYIQPRPRPKVTDGQTARVNTPRGPVYVTINEDDVGLCEVFVRSLDDEAETYGRLISMLLRNNADPRDVIEQLWNVGSRNVAYDRSADGLPICVTTVAQGIAVALGRYLYGDGFNPQKTLPNSSTLPEPHKTEKQLRFKYAGSVPVQVQENGNGNGKLNGKILTNGHHLFVGICPDCGTNLIRENGCQICKGCGYSRCG